MVPQPRGVDCQTANGVLPTQVHRLRECKKETFTAADCPREARVLYGKKISVEELLPLLLEDKDFYDLSGGGVTLSGGEWLMQADFCAELLKQLKKNGIHTAVDTCGFVSKEALDKVIPYTDVFLYDLKAYDEKIHIRCTGQSNKTILENLLYLDSQGKEIEIRIPYVPKHNGDQIEKLAQHLAPLKHVTKVRVLPYHNYAGSKYAALEMANILPDVLPTEEELQQARNVIRNITNFVVPT
jgi:pyruvate formate lyase activating enzyme